MAQATFLDGDALSVVRSTINGNATDAETRLAILESHPPFIINTPSDLDAFKSGSVYTIPPDSYKFTTSMSFGTDTIVLGTMDGCYLFQGNCLELVTYTGTDPFITGSTGLIFEIRNLFLTTPSATCIQLSNGNSIITDTAVLFTCELAMDLTTFAFLTLVASPIIACDDGIQATDVQTITARLPQFNAGSDIGGSYLTVDGAASERMIMSTIDARPESSESFINIAANYGGDVSIVGGVLEAGGGSFFDASGRDQTDIDIDVSSIKNVANSARIFSGHFTGNSTDTEIASAGVAVKIAGTWTTVDTQRFTFNAGGTATYIGKEDITIGASVIATVEPASGAEKLAALFIAKNGTVIATSKAIASVKSGAQISAVSEISLVTNDTIEAFIANEDDAIDLLVSTISFNGR